MRQETGANDQNQSASAEVAHDLVYDLFILAITIYSLRIKQPVQWSNL